MKYKHFFKYYIINLFYINQFSSCVITFMLTSLLVFKKWDFEKNIFYHYTAKYGNLQNRQLEN